MTVRRAVVLQHSPIEGPDRVAVALGARGVPCVTVALYAGEPVPAELATDELLIVMGGPMGVGDVGDPRWPFLAPELALLRARIARDAPVLGICLGAQLLAAAGGARIYPNTRPGADGAPEPAREVGWGAIDLIAFEREPVLAGLGPQLTVLHWHGDTFDLPAGAVHLASTPICAHQAFRLGHRQLGLQFHCEVEATTIPVWVREDAAFVRAANGDGGGARILADTQRLYAEARRGWDRLLGNAIALLLA